ncbi:hypothetical protein N7449_010304 [Penicillium cf. viridicatum]|uniref:Uncharacterized protein n=1 Tax=Penicillium cf. viridicatum TaxID=2972119 RepID=A0A9W9IYR9_9EURO|nr:hypothetical protein N7449_010304 [Penicillium cf. viridicatum]
MTPRPHGPYPTAMTPPAITHITRTTKHLKDKGSVAHVKTVLLLLEVGMVEEGMGEEDIVEEEEEEEEEEEVEMVAGKGTLETPPTCTIQV